MLVEQMPFCTDCKSAMQEHTQSNYFRYVQKHSIQRDKAILLVLEYQQRFYEYVLVLFVYLVVICIVCYQYYILTFLLHLSSSGKRGGRGGKNYFFLVP